MPRKLKRRIEMGGFSLRAVAVMLSTMFVLTTLVYAQKGTNVVRRINFQRGRTTAVVQGTVKRGISHDYLLRARRGQGMTVHLAAGREVGFEVITPGGQYMSGFAQDWSGYLPQSGDYRINVLPPTSTNAPARYTLEVTVR
jgi:hypothetical protein